MLYVCGFKQLKLASLCLFVRSQNYRTGTSDLVAVSIGVFYFWKLAESGLLLHFVQKTKNWGEQMSLHFCFIIFFCPFYISRDGSVIFLLYFLVPFESNVLYGCILHLGCVPHLGSELSNCFQNKRFG